MEGRDVASSRAVLGQQLTGPKLEETCLMLRKRNQNSSAERQAK